METLMLLFGIATVLAVLDALAVAYGAESRDGFAGDSAPTGLG